MNEITTSDIYKCFRLNHLPDDLGHFIKNCDLSYQNFSSIDREKLVIETLKKINSDTQIISSETRKQVWENGWCENYEKSVIDFSELSITPNFIRPSKIFRWKQEYIQPSSLDFEINIVRVINAWIGILFSEYSHIYEFGCGSCFNIYQLTKKYPQKKIFGLDFVQSSINIVKLLGEKVNPNVCGKLFDMKRPDTSFVLKENSAVLTFGAIEQLSGEFHEFLHYLIKNRVSLCVHIEPIVELYDENNLIDYLAIMFHKKRGYTVGFLSYLQLLEKEKKIEIVDFRRTFFGSRMMEGYTYIIWRPIET